MDKVNHEEDEKNDVDDDLNVKDPLSAEQRSGIVDS